MPTPDDNSTSDCAPARGSLIAAPSIDFDRGDPNWRAGNAVNPPVASSGLDAYLHAFRRHWLVTILVGLLCAAIAAPAVWFGYKPQFSAVSSLHIASNQQAILFTSPDHTATVFEIYKSTQQQYLKSRFVLTAALRNKPEFASFSVFRGEPDEVDWLGRNLSVEYPGNSEIMNVSLRGANAEEVSALVNAVVEAYMTEVVSKEQGQRAERLSQLDRLYADTENDWRSKAARCGPWLSGWEPASARPSRSSSRLPSSSLPPAVPNSRPST